jgi:hypothetical protein
MEAALSALYKYGLLLITDTPPEIHHVAAFAATISGGSVKTLPTQSLLPSYYDKVSDEEKFRHLSNTVSDGPMNNLYGPLWSTSAKAMAEGTSVSDSAYSSDR